MNTDKIYQDFTEKLLPKIQEGLVITKEYFTDLFGRYVKFLIISDSLELLGNIIFLAIVIISWFCFRKYTEKKILEVEDEEDKYSYRIVFLILTGFLLFSLFFISTEIINSAKNIFSDIYISEVRIYEIIKNK